MLVFLGIFGGSNLELKMETYEPIANNMLEFIMISFFYSGQVFGCFTSQI
jgi:hypothetical protein